MSGPGIFLLNRDLATLKRVEQRTYFQLLTMEQIEQYAEKTTSASRGFEKTGYSGSTKSWMNWNGEE